MTQLVEREVPGRRLYIIGFSNGGFGALALANKLKATAVVIIDAATAGLDATTALARAARGIVGIPFWAIYTLIIEQFRNSTRTSFRHCMTCA